MGILLSALYDRFERNGTVWKDWFKVEQSGNPAEREAIGEDRAAAGGEAFFE